jgi:cation diffusion facilitator CzcD-associated flavoprotein CzcO
MDCEVTQFIRTPQWIEICPNPEMTPEQQQLARDDPEAGYEIGVQLRTAINQDVRLTNPRWKMAPGELRDAASAALREDLDYIQDPVLRAMMTPDYEPGCKRIPKSVHYFDAIGRDNVTIIRGQVAQITETGVTMSDGRHTDVDVIVWATGFDAHAYMRPMEVYGVGGHRLNDEWADGPYSYRGVSVPNFPNFYLLHGPYSPVNNVPVPRTLDHETGYICALIKEGEAQGVSYAPTPVATARFGRLVEENIRGTVWDGDCDNWYKVDGKAIIWPWFEPEHQTMFEAVAFEDLEVAPLRPAPAPEAAP